MNFVIIGLGNFGASLAKKLSSMGHEVIGVDRDLSKVEFYKDRISQTICLDASDIHAIRSLPVADADMVVVAIGHDFGSSVMINALLKKMNVRNIIGRETSSIHITVMNALGITRTVNPEFDSASQFAEKLVMQGTREILPLSREIKIVEIVVPPSLVGQPVNIQQIREENDLELIAVKRNSDSTSSPANGDSCTVYKAEDLKGKIVFSPNDSIIVLGNKDDIQDFVDAK